MALYIFSHGYEGRLSKTAISRLGLIYYIDSAYRSDGRNGWITLSMGVDADKLPAMKELLRQELRRLVREHRPRMKSMRPGSTCWAGVSARRKATRN